MFSTAVEDGLLRSNPVHGVRIPAPTTIEMDDDHAKALTREELRRFLAAIPDDDWRLFFEFLVHTGLRISEAVGLRWEHVDLGMRPECSCGNNSMKVIGAGSSQSEADAMSRSHRGWWSG